MAEPARKQVPKSAELQRDEVADERDVSPRVVTDDTSGERVRAIPAKGGTLVRVSQNDFASHDVDNPTVEFSLKKDNFTLPVGNGLSQEAADFLTEEFPESFEYINKG